MSTLEKTGNALVHEYHKSRDTSQQELRKILRRISLPNFREEKKQIFVDLFNLYTPDVNEFFRHDYSGIAEWMWNLSEQGQNVTNAETVVTRLGDMVDQFDEITLSLENGAVYEALRSYEVAMRFYKILRKLKDFLNLEYIKIDKIYSTYAKNAKEASKNYEDAKIMYDNASEQSAQCVKYVEEVARSKAEVVSVLGIFASIILAFAVGLNLSMKAFEVLQTVLIYKVVALALLLIIGMFNALFFLLHLVAKMVDKDLFSPCSESTCRNYTCWDRNANKDGTLAITPCEKGRRKDCPKRCRFIKRFFRRLPVLAYFNLFAFIVLGIDITVWFFRLKYLV